MSNTARKIHYGYMYSYDREVGSDMPEPENWESELGLARPLSSVPINNTPIAQLGEATAGAEDYEDDAELLAYLKQQEEEAAFADFADIPADELFNWSDIDEDLGLSAHPDHDGMDLS
jgi:hypothetical protein